MKNTAVRTLLLLWASVVCQTAGVKDGTKAVAFSCRGRSPGYYADIDSGCQDYHMCDAGGRRYTYSCPNQTRFQQRVMICDHWFMVNCSLSETHFGANLLIGQKDRQFVEHFQQTSGHNEERSYPSRSRAFYAGPVPSASKEERTQTTNEIKQALFGKHAPLQSATRKFPQEKDSKTPNNNRYYSQFSTPTGSIKPTTERSLSREFTNNPFFRSLTEAPASLADKGESGSLTFISPHQSDAVSTSGTPRTTTSPLPSRRTASALSTPPQREATPILRNTPSFPNYQQRRTSTLVTTAVPLTYDYSFVTPEGHSNHLTQTETPNLRNNLSKVIPNYGGFTSEPTLTTRYESLKTRERTDMRAPHESGVTPSPRAENSHALNATQGGGSQPTSDGSGQYRPNVTQGVGGLQKTPGGFRFTSVNAAQVPDARLPSFTPLVPIVPEKISSGAGRVPTGSGGIFTGSGAVATNRSGVRIGSGGVFADSGVVSTGSGGIFTGGGAVATSRNGVHTGSGGVHTGSSAVATSRNGDPTGSSGIFTGGGAVATSRNGVPGVHTGSSAVATSRNGVPTGSGGIFTGGGAVATSRNGVPTGNGGVHTGSSAVATSRNGVPISSGGVFTGSARSPSGPSVGSVAVPILPDATRYGGGFPAGLSEPLAGTRSASTGPEAPNKVDLLSAPDAVSPSSPGEDEDDYNTVEVRIPDPRRMFFIPDSAAREAEMLSSNNETIFKISLPSARPHGAMRFKGVRGSEGRRADCPQCHPAFLLPGKCQPCVLIRR